MYLHGLGIFDDIFFVELFFTNFHIASWKVSKATTTSIAYMVIDFKSWSYEEEYKKILSMSNNVKFG